MFKGLLVDQGLSCFSANEKDEVYWHPGARIEIRFLPYGRFEDDGRYRMFDVTIRDN